MMGEGAKGLGLSRGGLITLVCGPVDSSIMAGPLVNFPTCQLQKISPTLVPRNGECFFSYKWQKPSWILTITNTYLVLAFELSEYSRQPEGGYSPYAPPPCKHSPLQARYSEFQGFEVKLTTSTRHRQQFAAPPPDPMASNDRRRK